jgi:hypothetical protein
MTRLTSANAIDDLGEALVEGKPRPLILRKVEDHRLKER